MVCMGESLAVAGGDVLGRFRNTHQGVLKDWNYTVVS